MQQVSQFAVLLLCISFLPCLIEFATASKNGDSVDRILKMNNPEVFKKTSSGHIHLTHSHHENDEPEERTAEPSHDSSNHDKKSAENQPLMFFAIIVPVEILLLLKPNCLIFLDKSFFKMEILKSNFESILPEMLEAMRHADFVAIDTNAEATGFLMADETLNSRQLKGQEWYGVLKKHQKTRSPLEFGIAIFTQDRSVTSKRFIVKCYNIPMLFAYVEEHDARQEIRDARYGEERLDIDGIGFEFLQRINYDIDKTLYEGTPFINKERANEAIDYMEKNPDFMVINGKHVTNGELDDKYFPKVIEKLEPNDIQEIIERLRGIGKFFDVTAQTKVPVIGHNLLIKLVMLYKDFVEFAPKDYSEFLQKLELVLPQYYDTKYICSEFHSSTNISQDKKSMTKDTTLYQMFRNLSWIGQFSLEFVLDAQTHVYQMDFGDLSTELLEKDPTSFCFESGFDAMLAGMIFTKLAILTCGSFSLENFQEYAKLWKNKPYVQDDYKDVLLLHVDNPELTGLTEEPRPGSSKACFSSYNTSNGFTSKSKVAQIQPK